MTTPTNLPTGYAGDSTDFLKVKRDTFGALRMSYATIAVADSASAGTTYGLVPFQKGFRLNYGGSAVHSTDLDTASNVTLNIGYVYKTGSTATDDPDAFAAGVSAQTAGFVALGAATGLDWVAEDDGWIQVALAAGPVTTAGTFEAQIVGTYDPAN